MIQTSDQEQQKEARPCPKCGSTARYPSGECKPCNAKRTNLRRIRAAFGRRNDPGPCRKCGASDRFPTGDCRPCNRARRQALIQRKKAQAT